MSILAFVVLTVALVTVSAAPSTEEAKYCGGTIREPGVFKSPPPFKNDDDFKVLQEMNCIWHIEAPKDKKVVLKITQTVLDSAWGNKCKTKNDHVAVFDGLTTDPEKRLAIICNKRNSTIVFSSTDNALTVQFRTYNHLENSGFNSEIVFSYPESVGCGGSIKLTATTDYTLKSPQMTTQGGNILDCKWNFKAPKGMAIKVSFSLFQITCRRDYGLEIRNGNGPDNLLLGSYCGDILPPVIMSSVNKIGIRLSSDVQADFIATLTIQEETCNSSIKIVEPEFVQPRGSFKSPGYSVVPVARGIHCGAEFRCLSTYTATVVRIKNLDIQPGSAAGKCDKDKLIIGVGSRSPDDYPDPEYSIENNGAYYLYHTAKLASIYDDSIFVARQYVLCGSHQNIDFYLPGPVLFNLITTPEVVLKNYDGVEIEVFYKPSCDKRNYTEPYGRIMNYGFDSGNCSTLISAPEGYTISIYFINFRPSFSSSTDYLDIYDGDTIDSNLLNTTQYCSWPSYVLSPVFSTGNNLLLHRVKNYAEDIFFDSVYMITNKGGGCGGYIFADQGVVTSPFYPVTYKEAKSCEFELETPVGTRVHLRFAEFDLGDDCASNFVQLLNREGKVLSTICTEKPSAFTSEENYVKIVSVTTDSNRGKGWHAMFGSAS